MALGFYFAPASFSTAQYDDAIRRLTKAGAKHPAGRTYHAAFGTPEKLMVFDVWTSQAAFDAFGKTLMPILKELGVDPGQLSVMAVHNVVVPPAPAPAAKKSAARKPAARAKARRRAVKGKRR